MPFPDLTGDAAGVAHPLAAIGWSSRLAARFAPYRDAGLAPGRVVRVDRGRLLVAIARQEIRAAPSTALLGAGPDQQAVTGDWVALRSVPGLDHALIEAVLERTSAFRRYREGAVQVLAANLDVVFVVVPAGVGEDATAIAARRSAIQADGSVRRLDRELALAFESGAQPVIVLSKVDLQPDVARAVAAVQRVAGDVPVHATSAATGAGIDALRAYASGGRTVALIGASGVGKSTIANALLGDETLATGHVRESDARGRHTTTARHLVALPGGGALIDTPGIRTLGLWDAEDAVDRVYDDVAALAARCRFHDCAHEREPGCAVRAAIEGGTLDAARLTSYRKLQREAALEERKRDPKLQAEARQDDRRRWKGVIKKNRAKAKSRWRDG